MDRLGEEAAADLWAMIRALQSPSLDADTVARNGWRKPLIDTGQMLGSVDSRRK